MPRRAMTGFAPGTIGQFGQRRQEAGQRLAGAGRRDQEHRLSGLRLRQQLKLMGARRPAFLAEPSDERFGQNDGGILFGKARLLGHAREVARAMRNRQGKSEQKVIGSSPRPVYGARMPSAGEGSANFQSLALPLIRPSGTFSPERGEGRSALRPSETRRPAIQIADAIDRVLQPFARHQHGVAVGVDHLSPRRS